MNNNLKLLDYYSNLKNMLFFIYCINHHLKFKFLIFEVYLKAELIKTRPNF